MVEDSEGAGRGGVRSPGLTSWLRLARVFRKVEHLATEQMRQFGLSQAQFDVLAQVGAAEGRSQGELAKALLVTKGNICQLLDRMERDGLLRRQQEGRTNRLFLTERGRLLRDKAVPTQEALIARLFSVLTHEEQVHLLGALRALDHSLMDDQHTGDSPMSAPTESQTAQAVTWQIDPAHSLIEFAVKHMMFTTVKGRFATVSGTIVEDSQNFSRSQVNVEIAVDSITTGEPQRDGHLKSPDFFDAAQFPTITFKSTSVQPGSGDHFTLVGDLTIHGVTQAVTLKAERGGSGTNPFGKVVSGFSAETAISRKEFGLSWNVALEAGGVLVSDNVKISLDIQAVKQD
jgi:polyisoprenoid-binding protein YceI